MTAEVSPAVAQAEHVAAFVDHHLYRAHQNESRGVRIGGFAVELGPVPRQRIDANAFADTGLAENKIPFCSIGWTHSPESSTNPTVPNPNHLVV